MTFFISEVRISESSSFRQNHVLQSLNRCYCDEFLFNAKNFTIQIILSSPCWKKCTKSKSDLFHTIQDRNNHPQHLLDLSPDFDQKHWVSKQSKHSKNHFPHERLSHLIYFNRIRNYSYYELYFQ